MAEEDPYVPSLTIYKEILFGIANTWYSCDPWGISMVEVEIIFYICCMFLIFYFYVMGMIIRCIWKNPKFRNSFYYCSVVLAVGDIITIITCAREGAIQSCVLSIHPDRHMAWESIGAFCVDLIFTVNLIMALVRLNAIIGITRHSSPKQNEWLMNFLLFFAVCWAILMYILYFLGKVKRIWYLGFHYNSEFKWPFDLLRTQIQITELVLTFGIYVIAFLQLNKIKATRSSAQFTREYRFLLLAGLIFASELLYYYSTDWVGSLIFNWGSDEFNAKLNYFLRPVTTGITPIFYLIFSIDLRHVCLHPFMSAIPQKITPVSSAVAVKKKTNGRNRDETP